MNLTHFNSGFPLIPSIILALAAITLIVMGILNLVGAKQQASAMQETGVFVTKSKSVSTNATKAGWIKIGIGAAIIWGWVIVNVIMFFLPRFGLI